MTRRRNYLLEYENKPLPSLDECVISCGERIAFTKVGRRRFTERFARAGIDINRIRDWVAFDDAMVRSFHVDLEEVARMFDPSRIDPLELKAFRALERGDHEELARLLSRLEARRRLRLV